MQAARRRPRQGRSALRSCRQRLCWRLEAYRMGPWALLIARRSESAAERRRTPAPSSRAPYPRVSCSESGCAVSGTPTAAGTVNLTVTATDAGSPAETVTGPVSLTISPAAPALTTGSLPNGTVGTPYSATIGVTGGTSPYSCNVTAGTLPAGLTLGAACLVSGTPTLPGTANLTVKAADSESPAQSTSGHETITISAAAPTLVISVPPPATVSTPYTGTIPVTGGTGPYSCTINSGSLPSGLSLGANCVITGTPTTAGSSIVSVASDGLQQSAGEYYVSGYCPFL